VTLRENVKSFVKNHSASAIVWTCYGITALSIIVRIIMYTQGRSLWWDEAALAESIITRSFCSLLASPLANGQTAPALYLYVEKLFGTLTGYSEGGLRLFSLFMFLGMLPLEYYFLNSVFKVGKVWTAFAVALTAINPVYLRYSNELKPYMGDVFFALLLLFLYHRYTEGEGKVRLPLLTAASCGIILFSTSAVFFAGGVFICEFIGACAARDKGRVIKTFCAGAIVLAFFLAYYMWWLMPAAESTVMADFWKSRNLAIWPLNKETLIHDIKLMYEMIGGFGGCLCFAFACIGLIASMVGKNKISWAVFLSFIQLFFASSIGKFPMASRLWLFFFVMNVMYMVVCFVSVKAVLFEQGSLHLKRVLVFFACVMALLNVRWVVKTTEVGLFPGHYDVNPLIAYVEENIKPNEHLYVLSYGNVIVKYKNGYDTNRIGNAVNDNIIWGGDARDWGELTTPQDPVPRDNGLWPWWGEPNQNGVTEIDKVVAAKKVYILICGVPDKKDEAKKEQVDIGKGLAELASLGYLHKVGEFHKTPLYYFTTDPEDPKRSETHDFGR